MLLCNHFTLKREHIQQSEILLAKKKKKRRGGDKKEPRLTSFKMFLFTPIVSELTLNRIK